LGWAEDPLSPDPTKYHLGDLPALNPYDENAMEVALQLKGRLKEAMVTALTLGGDSADKALRRVLGMGCDEAIWLKDPFFEDLDPFGIAKVLSKAIKKLGNIDLVLCGRQAGDWPNSTHKHS
jgi:electron transfer flavoprotein beta subunit